jgi:cytochrome P450
VRYHPARMSLPVPGPTPRELLPRLRHLQQDPLGFLLELTREYGPFAQIPVPGLRVFNIARPEAIKHVLQDKAQNYSKRTLQFTHLALVTGQGLLSSDGEFWLRQRRMAQPAFHRHRIAGFGAAMTDAALRMLERWRAKEGQALDIDHEMMEMTLEIVGLTLFSSDFSASARRMVEATLTALDFVMHKAQNPFGPPTWLPTARNRRFKRALKLLDQAVYRLIEERQARGQPHDDLLSMLLEARDEEGSPMSLRQLRDEVITLIIAGHETVASALTWTWHLLARHPEAEARLHAELERVLAGRTPTVDDLPELPYTRAVFEEALRLYPPAWLITRRAIGPDSIGPYEIPKGSLLVLSPYIVHRQAEVWSEAERFRPERFLEGSPGRYAYIPFGGGPRLCIGNAFALVEGQLILATVAQHYRLRHADPKPVEAAPLVTIRPRGGLWMRLEAR